MRYLLTSGRATAERYKLTSGRATAENDITTKVVENRYTRQLEAGLPPAKGFMSVRALAG